ncbi:Uncharacterised protein [Vibrio cholerae]|nr:Uncharacterised protein [Vibrio cholerae]CSI21008.1 Uncharacterised protein [Vibrio cholerae]
MMRWRITCISICFNPIHVSLGAYCAQVKP